MLDLPPWTPRDRAALAATLLLVPLLMAAPYHNLGGASADGTKHYRAYFTADFVWHAALTNELGRFQMPPRNPYMARESLHYYWTYFLVPAAASSAGPPAVRDVEAVLKVNAIATAALLIAAFFLLAWSAGAGAGRRGPGGAARGGRGQRGRRIRDQGPAAERRAPVEAARHQRRRDHGVEVRRPPHRRRAPHDVLHAAARPVVRHGLLALVPVALSGASGRLGSIAVSGLLLGLATTLNPFLGAAFSLIYGLAIVADAIRTRASIAQVLRHAVAAAPPGLAIVWGMLNAMGEGAGDAVTIAWAGHARRAPVVTLLLSLGPVLVPALAGLLPSRRLPTPPVIVAACGLSVGLWLLYFVVLSEASWVGFRAGQILLALVTIPLARLLAMIGAWSTHEPRARRGRGAGRRHPRHRGTHRRRRHLQRIGHREPRPGARVSVDADGDAGTAGGAGLGEATHATDGGGADGCAGAWPGPLEFHPDLRGPAHGGGTCPSRCCLVRTTSGRHSRCARSSTAAIRPSRTRSRDGWASTISGWTTSSAGRTRAARDLLAASSGYFTPVFDNGEVQVYRAAIRNRIAIAIAYPFRYRQNVRAPMNQSRRPIFLPSALLRGL